MELAALLRDYSAATSVAGPLSIASERSLPGAEVKTSSIPLHGASTFTPQLNVNARAFEPVHAPPYMTPVHQPPLPLAHTLPTESLALTPAGVGTRSASSTGAPYYTRDLPSAGRSAPAPPAQAGAPSMEKLIEGVVTTIRTQGSAPALSMGTIASAKKLRNYVNNITGGGLDVEQVESICRWLDANAAQIR